VPAVPTVTVAYKIKVVKEADHIAFELVVQSQDMLVEFTFQEGHGPYVDLQDPLAFRELAQEVLDDVFDTYITINSPLPHA
jgi:hypothetical protein